MGKRLFRFNSKKALGSESGFTYMEMVATLSILVILAAVVYPTYLQIQGDSKIRISQANMLNVQQALINHFYTSVIDRNEKEFPSEPADHQMTRFWADTTTLFNGKSISQLFSKGYIPYNGQNQPFLYYKLSVTPLEEEGFKLVDPMIGDSLFFRP